ncbi:MAG: methyltransferase domain-containing protein [Armatimonadia bacterium]|nr:methyltransferase domain-containing protein [Armatimonadia bacterium]
MSRELFVTLSAGLEEVTGQEVIWRLPDSRLLAADSGKVFFSSDASPEDTLGLRSVNHVHVVAAHLDGIDSGAQGLEQIEALASAVDFLPGAFASAEINPWKTDPPTFRVTGYRSGEQEYGSMDVAARVGAGVVARHGWPVDLESYDVEIVAYLTDDRLLMGTRLTREGSLHRRHRVGVGKSTLKASVAFSLCWLADLHGAQALVDPLCGAATIPTEAALQWPHLDVIGGDRSADELDLARRNVELTGAAVSLCRWDCRELPLARSSVDRIVSDLPFGRRVGSHQKNVHLYPRMVREMGRVLEPGGLMVALTLERKLFTRLIDRSPVLHIERVIGISLSGLRPSVYLVRRG